jgi:hypothetical protein
MKEFSQKTKEELKHYVYALIDPRDNKIFYVGKGSGDRVFQHAKAAIETFTTSDKLDTIREIINGGNEVKHYIVRHGLEQEYIAFILESVLIDFLTFKDFSEVAKITNIVAGHHSFDKGIKTVDELEQFYNCEELELNKIKHNLLAININRTFKIKDKELLARHPNIYEATRKSWAVDINRAKQVDYVLSEYKGIVRAIFKPTKWEKDGKRWMFEGEKITDEEILGLYLHKDISKYKGTGQVIRYFSKSINI